ncbi:MAG: F-box-like domain-containing protein [Kistimonas sp.]|nr:F-box-like domain-containing protein [Kistimonas sp.]
MIHRFPDGTPAPRRSPATPTPSQGSGTLPPDAHAAHPDGGRCVATRSASDSAVPQTGQSADLANKDTTATPSLAQNLPTLVLEKIFHYLPVSAQCQCARVCHHWGSCLPSLHQRLTRWLQEEHPESYQASPGWGQGFLSRTHPFVQATNSSLLPILMQLQQEQQSSWQAAPRQDAQPVVGDPGCDLLSALVHYSLKTQLTRADRLILRPAVMNLPDEAPMESFKFSFCSRWLAMRCRHGFTGHRSLRLYGWENNSWQPCPLTPHPTQPVSGFRFTPVPPETLISIYGPHVVAWRRQADTNTWHHTLVHTVPATSRILGVWPMTNGDQVILAQTEQQHRAFLTQLSCHTWHGKSWKTVTTCHTGLSEWQHRPQSSELAQGQVTEIRGPDYFSNEVLIWRKGLNTRRPGQWGYQATALPWHHAAIQRLVYSPGGTYLLGVLTDGQSCLWSQDAQCRLREQLMLPACLPPGHRMPSYPASFSADEKQLALVLATRQIQLCYRDDKDDWQRGQVLEAPFAPADRPDTELTNVLLSSSGGILVQAGTHNLSIWQRDLAGHWHHRVQRRNEEGAVFPASACLLNVGELVCTTAKDPTLSLWIHGPDSQGRLVTKACLATHSGIGGASPDGLSLVVSSTEAPPCLLQMTPAQDRQASQQTHFSGKCRLL